MKIIILSNLIQFFIAIVIGLVFLLVGKIIVKITGYKLSDIQLAKNFVFIFFIYKALVININMLFDINLDFLEYLSNLLLME